MIKSYLKLAWKVLLRRKFFTFISLFGIAFTLVVLTLVTALLDHVVSAYPPETNHARTVGIHFASLQGEHWRRNGFAGYAMLDKYARNLPNVEQMAIASMPSGVYWYLNGQRLKSFLKRTDGAFWQILNFEFIEGGPYTETDVADHRLVAVINEATRQRFFGGQPALGKMIEVDGQRYTVVGVVPDVPILRIVPFADVWVPHTTAKSDSYTREYVGDFMGILLLRDPSKVSMTRDEFWSRLRSAKLPDGGFNRLDATPETLFDTIGRMFTGDGTGAGDGPRPPAGDRAHRGGLPVHAAAGGEPHQPEHEPDHGTLVGDRRPQGLRRVVAHSGRPVHCRESGPDARRRGRRLRILRVAASRDQRKRRDSVRGAVPELPHLRLGRAAGRGLRPAVGRLPGLADVAHAPGAGAEGSRAMIRHVFRLIWNRKRTNFLMMTEIFVAFLVLFAVVALGVYTADNWRRPHRLLLRPRLERVDRHESGERRLLRRWPAGDRPPADAGGEGISRGRASAGTMLAPYQFGSSNSAYEWNGRRIEFGVTEATDDFKDVLGLKLIEGRWFGREDDGQAYNPVVINQAMRTDLSAPGRHWGRVSTTTGTRMAPPTPTRPSVSSA